MQWHDKDEDVSKSNSYCDNSIVKSYDCHLLAAFSVAEIKKAVSKSGAVRTCTTDSSRLSE